MKLKITIEMSASVADEKVYAETLERNIRDALLQRNGRDLITRMEISKSVETKTVIHET